MRSLRLGRLWADTGAEAPRLKCKGDELLGRTDAQPHSRSVLDIICYVVYIF